MGNTIRRQPVNFNIPNSPNYKFLNITDFKGLNITDNPFIGDPNTASDLLNVYVDEQNALTTRPRLQKQNTLSDVDVVFKVVNLLSKRVYHYKKGNAVGLKVLDKHTNTVVDVDLATNNIQLSEDYCCVFEKNNNIYVMNNNQYFVVKEDNIARFVENDSDTYIPTAYTGYYENGNIVKKPKEAINVLNNRLKTEYFWDVTQDLSKAINKNKVVENGYVFKYNIPDAPGLGGWTNYTGEYEYCLKTQKNKFLIFASRSGSSTKRTITITGVSAPVNDGRIKLSGTYDSSASFYDLEVGKQLFREGKASDACFVTGVNGDALTLYCSVNSPLATLKSGDVANFYESDYYYAVHYDIDDKSLLNKSPGARYYTETHPSFNEDGSVGLCVSGDNKLAYLIDNNSSYEGLIVFDEGTTVVTASWIGKNRVVVLTEEGSKKYLVVYAPSATNNGFYYSKTHKVEFSCEYHDIFMPWARKLINVDSATDSAIISIPNNDSKLFRVVNLTTNPEITEISCTGLDLRNWQSITISNDLSTFVLWRGYYTHEQKTMSVFDISTDSAVLIGSHEFPDIVYNLCFTDGDNLLCLLANQDLYHVVPQNNTQYRLTTLYTPDDFDTYWSGGVYTHLLFNGEVILRKYTATGYNTYRFAVNGITTSETPQLLVEESVGENKKIEPENMFRFQNNYWFYGKNNSLVWTNNNDPTYIGENNYAEIGDANDVITDAVVVSYDVATIFKKDNMYVVSPLEADTTQQVYSVVNAKSTVGVDAPHSALISPLNEMPLYVNAKGIYSLQQLQNVQSSQNISVLMSEAINPKWLKTQSLKDLWTLTRLYWTMFVLPKENTTHLYLLDDRTSEWFYWEFPVRLVSGWVEENTIFVTDHAGKTYTLETSDIINEFNPDRTEYYDDDKKLIEWFWKSQVLHLGTMNNSKKLVDTTFIVADTEMSDEYGLNYAYTAYRKMLSETAPTTISSKLNYVQSTTKRTMIPRFNFLQLKISNVEDDFDNNKLRLIGLGLKYVLLEGLLR